MTVFTTILNMSITGTIAAVCVILLRFLLKKTSAWIRCALWAVVFLRLLVPFSVSSQLSLLGKVGAPMSANGVVEYLPSEHKSNIGALAVQPESIPASSGASGDLATSLAPTPQASIDPVQVWLAMGFVVWVSGLIILLLYAAIQYFRLHRRVRDAVIIEPQVFETDAVTAPFVLGIFRPRIILPTLMTPYARELVLRHERAHLLRLDHVVKPLIFLVVSIHWFNPIVWLAFRLFCYDLEESCDERAVRSLDRAQIAAYGETLLQFSTTKIGFAGGPLAFGEHCAKERIINVLNYKKPALWIVAVGLLTAVSAAVALLTNPILSIKQAIKPTINEMQPTDFNFDEMSFIWTTSDGNGAQNSLIKGVPDVGATLECSGSIDNLLNYSVDPSVLGTSDLATQLLPGFLERLANGQMYIRAYLEQNAKGCYDAEAAQRIIDYSVQNQDVYSYYLDENNAKINIGDYYWHCSQYQVFLLLHPSSLHWQHYGYAEYLGCVLNPYDMWLQKINERGVSVDTFGSYAQTYLEQGGDAENLSSDDYRLLIDSAAYECLINGMNWGTAYESYPITTIYGFTEPAEQGDDMSVIMAGSFCAYLADHYGFDRLTSYCAGNKTFQEAFGLTYDRAFDGWQKQLTRQFA